MSAGAEVTHRDVARAPGGIRYVVVGAYQVVTGALPNGNVVVRHFRGEAMETTPAKLEAALEQFFRAEF